MDKRRNHIIFWVGYFLYYYILYYFLSKNNIAKSGDITMTLLFISVFRVSSGTIMSFYILILYIFPLTFPLKKYFKLFFFLIILWVVIFAFNYQVGWLFHTLFPQNISLPSIGTNNNRALKSVEHSFGFALIFWFTKITISNAKYERILQEKQNLLRNNILSAELLALKNQINPHFFYNMLNFFYAQFLPYSKKTSSAILKLSEMMRYTIRDGSYEGKVLLEDEIKYLKGYIELENINKHSPEMINIYINGNPIFRRVRPLIFQHILVHSCLFGIKIRIEITISDNRVILSSCYTKKDNVSMPIIFSSVDNIKQKLSNMKDCEVMFDFADVEHKFQISLVS